MTRQHLRALLAAPALVLALAACGGSDGAAPSSAGSSAGARAEASDAHNAADVTFAQDMIPHHRQALQMTELALNPERGASPEVVDLAERIAAAQGPEIEAMSAWLTSWDEEVPADHSGMGGMGHGGDAMGGMQGMASESELETLGKATGPDFDTIFLTLMAAHHEGAVAQSETELADGTYPPALELAQEIIDGQKAEIEEMNGLLAAA